MEPQPVSPSSRHPELMAFSSDVVDRIRAAGNVWQLPWGRLRIPRVFGFCRGVERALAMLARALLAPGAYRKRFVLLGEVIHNPWVNRYFSDRGVRILSPQQRNRLAEHLQPDDCAVVPAFGVPLPIQQRLNEIGCEIIDTTCGDVLRLRKWACQTAGDGYALLIYGKARHDETVMLKSYLQASGASYLVVGSLAEADRFCRMIAEDRPREFTEAFGPDATNAPGVDSLLRLAQVSQTTMLYEDTLAVRERLSAAFEQRFGPESADRLRFQPTVCRATQQRQRAATELCRSGCDLVFVVGGFGSSNSRHLFELSRAYGPAFFIEDASALLSADEIRSYDPDSGSQRLVRPWRPTSSNPTIGVLAGASSPEVVVGEVLERLAALMSA